MGKPKRDITVLAIGDMADYDAFKKFHREKKLFLRQGFNYASVNYRRFLKEKLPPIKTEKIIIFLFFPFYYWNRYIEHKNYKGIYGNARFFREFNRFWKRVDKIIKKNLSDKRIFFVNTPRLSGLYRDKLIVLNKLSKAGILTPKLHEIKTIKKIRELLNKGQDLFLKVRYGSMGKGITFLSWMGWQTNFIFKNDKIVNRLSDRGWAFKTVTGNSAFLRKLLKKDILIEEAVDYFTLDGVKVDLRIYVFFNKVTYVYPRRNKLDKITTNITQGGKGDPRILPLLPKNLVNKAKNVAIKTSKALGLNLLGMDVVPHSNLKDVYVIDVNVFPGFPKRKTFNITRRIIQELVKAVNKKEVSF